MQHIARSIISGLAAVWSWQIIALSIGHFNFSDADLQRVVLATCVSASGGLAAALVPLDEKSWTWLGFFRLIVLGALVGIPLSNLPAIPTRIGDGKPFVLFAAGILAYPIIRAIQRTGPVKLLWSFLAKFRPVNLNDTDK